MAIKPITRFMVYAPMFKHTCFLLFFGLLSFTVRAQSGAVHGILVDETNSPAIGASVILLNPADSAIIKGITTGIDGNFKLEGLEPRAYILKLVMLGYKTILKPIDVPNSTLELGTIALKQNATKLKEVTVEAKIPLATQNGDTTSYSSNAYKVNKDATAEDLVTKMPGVTITDGKVQAQGEDVKQVLVDGKPFFGDDPNAVLKNLPAEIIDKVQVFDKKSDQAQFTGFDDGNASKTINIVTKQQFRNGVFGKIYGGYGYEDKYKGGATVNIFKGNRRISVLAQSNNINEQNFSAEDLVGVSSSSGSSGGGSRGGGRGGGQGGPPSNSDNFLVNNQNGINTTSAFGINYSDKWNKKTDITAAYFFNWTNNNSTSTLFRQYIIGSSHGQVYNENNVAKSDNYNNRLNLRFETKLDSQNSIILQPKLSFQTNNSTKNLNGANTRISSLLSNTQNGSSSNLNGYNISFPILYRHSFAKRGRTLSVNLSPSINSNAGNSTLYTLNNFYTDTSLVSDTIDQHSNINKQGFSGTGNISYTEPLSKNHFLLLNYNTSYINNYSSKKTYNRDYPLTDYTSLDSSLTNVFGNTYQSQAGSLGYRYQKDKLNFSTSVAYQWADLTKSQQIPSSYTLGKTFESVLPTAQFQYRFSQKKNLRINYRTNNDAPSVDQLQNVINNSNSLQLSTGNPDLKQDFQQTLNIRYSSVNTEKATSLFVLFSGNASSNYIGNSTLIASRDTVVYNNVYLAKGSQIQRPVNIDGYYTLRSFVNYSFPLKKIRTNLNINASANYNHVPGVINGNTNYANTATGILGLVFSSNISEKIDFTLSSNSSYSNINNTLQTSSNSTYLIQASKVKINVMPWKWLVLQTEYNNQYYSGLSSTYNQSISLWNAAVGYKFLKNKQAELRLIVYDMLNQNNNVQRTNTDSYIQDSQTNVLKRYYMLMFTYNFKKYAEKKDGK
ncbi:MAG: outer membrane beta-barrel protein [Bacteroidetes bacterium]|nr:outer membrane beta-barrel protein [Bacteroidota bacterium]